MTQCVVYWIHLASHKDIKEDGYVGITVNFKRRMAAHNREARVKYQGFTIQNAILKHGWSNIKREIVFTGTIEECRLKEFELRSKPNTGWNMAVGGQDHPTCRTFWLGKKLTEEHKQKMRDADRPSRAPKTRSERIKEVQTLYEATLIEAISKGYSRTFLIIKPDNTIDYCENLSEYCKSNNLRQNCMSQCAAGSRQQHKNHYCIRITP